ncbi:hypothetical protein SAMN05444001_11299 [Parabacteroides chinchillae]|uniref:Uncharacterized protein n=1 Tax=Parabacteroides chinchillae TaxID=871327 RepID=A0A8G2F5H2_9BACT|nr:hypothetical protein SAMN05444001_11299 [Parabacteroides chinchillae]
MINFNEDNEYIGNDLVTLLCPNGAFACLPTKRKKSRKIKVLRDLS